MDDQTARLARAISTLLGWIYFLAWSGSFYPQPLLNWRRKSTQGLTVDFPALNVLGFVSYTITTSTFLFSPVIRDQYAARHPAAPSPTVRVNDFAFGTHATVLVILTYSQFYPTIWGFQDSQHRRMSILAASVIFISVASVLGVTLMVVAKKGYENNDPYYWNWIDIIYTFGHIKLLATFFKYVPQAWMNYKRKSTLGWSIAQVLMDFTGGIASLLQLLIDSSFQNDWSGVTGNPVKFGLANISMAFDLIFMFQHYVLYGSKPEIEETVNEPDAHQHLLSNSE